MTTITRRRFLGSAVKSAAALGMMGSFGRMNAFASSGSYQALVMINLYGGNDGHNTVIPISTAQQNYSAYSAVRGPLTLPQTSLLPIADGTDTYGLHPSLRETQLLYNLGKVAILPNVGNLVQPLTLAQFNSNDSAIVPAALLSHPDQTSQWQSGDPTGASTNGWGGRTVDQLGLDTSSFPVIADVSSSGGGCLEFCNGVQSLPAGVPAGVVGASGPPTNVAALDVASGSAAYNGQQQLLSFSNGLTLAQAGNDIMSRGSRQATTLSALLQSNRIKTPFPQGSLLANQLYTVANVMAVSSQLGLTRQIFFCQLCAFDTHDKQMTVQQGLLQQVDQAVGAFYTATLELGIARNVVTFTTSEFGRTLSPSGTGTDHGWGNHHFVIGGSVAGGRMYGTFPELQLGNSQDATGRGVYIPTTSLAQYGATLAHWFGVGSDNMAAVFPNIGNFQTSNLGFMG
jgi:uncharacterized protein (DUF1501 family)